MTGPIPLPLSTVAALGGRTHKVIITYADLAALGASATGVIQVFPGVSGVNGPAQMLVGNFMFDLVTAFDFSDSGITSLTVQAGLTGGTTNAYMAATEIAVDGTEILGFAAGGASTHPAVIVAADTIDLLFTAANGGSPLLSETTSGEIHVYFTAIPTKTLRAIE